MPEKDWNLRAVNARQALAMMPRLPGQPDRIDWREVEIAQIDTGYTEHAVFGPWVGGQGPALRIADGLNLLEPGRPPRDPLDYVGTPGHGTRILSVLCGNLPGSMVGVAPGVPTIPYRCVNHVVIAAKDARKRLAAALFHAVDINSAEVVSMSLGFPQMSVFGQRHLGEAVDHAYERGVIVVAAGGQIVDRVSYPGKFSRTIGVGGIGPDREVWFRYDESMARRSIDIWAPADPIFRANSILQGTTTVDAPYETGDGTSYATVHVAAAAAMWLAKHDEAVQTLYAEPWQRVEAFRAVLHATSQPVSGTYWPDPTRGILDIAALLGAELPQPATLTFEDRKAANEIF